MVHVAAVVAVLHRLAYNFGAGPDDNEHKEFLMGKEQIMIKEQQVACITRTNPKKVLKHAELVVAISNNTTKPPSSSTPPVPTSEKMLLQLSGLIALDARLTDDDVIALLQTAYPEKELEEIQGKDKIMEQYFTCVHHDRDVIRSHITGEPLLYNQEMESAGEAEEDDDSTGEDGEEDSVDEDADDSGSDDNCNATDLPNLPT